jgi:hypothetical protein
LSFIWLTVLNSAAITSAICRADGFLSFEILSAASFARVAKLLVARTKGIVAGWLRHPGSFSRTWFQIPATISRPSPPRAAHWKLRRAARFCKENASQRNPKAVIHSNPVPLGRLVAGLPDNASLGLHLLNQHHESYVTACLICQRQSILVTSSIDDGRDLNDHPPVDAKLDWRGRLHRAQKLVNKAHNDSRSGRRQFLCSRPTATRLGAY